MQQGSSAPPEAAGEQPPARPEVPLGKMTARESRDRRIPTVTNWEVLGLIL